MTIRSLLLVAIVPCLPACLGPSGQDAALEDPYRPASFSCAPEDGPSDPFVDCVDAIVVGGDVTHGHDRLPAIVLGPPQGAGEAAGSTDVAALGCGGSITLSFDGPPIVDGPGPDLIVFENAFIAGAIEFVEPGEVLVSADGVLWHAFACDPIDGDGCAGMSPVLAMDASTATQPSLAGGDAFDLAEIEVSEIRWIRIVDRTREHYGDDLWCKGAAGGFDLDAVARVEAP